VQRASFWRLRDPRDGISSKIFNKLNFLKRIFRFFLLAKRKSLYPLPPAELLIFYFDRRRQNLFKITYEPCGERLFHVPKLIF
jgi:hypothetical protein